MEFDEMLISTGVESLIKLVREKGKIEITMASRLLNIPISTIEEWSHALESEGIISIEYQLTKVYLKWTAITEEKATAETQKLETEKSGLVKEVMALEEKSQANLKAVQGFKDEFNANYEKLAAKLDELSKKGAVTGSSRAGQEDAYYKALDQLEEVRSQVGQVKDSIAFTKEQLEKTRNELIGSDVEKKTTALVSSRKNISSLKKELESMEAEVSKLAGTLSSKKMDVPSLRKTADTITSEYSSVKQRLDKEKEVLGEMNSLLSLVGGAKKEISTLRSSTESVMKELKGFKGTHSELEKKASSASKALAENEERATALLESLKTAEDTLAHIAPEGQAKGAMAEFVAEGKALEEKITRFQDSVEEALPLFENVDKLLSNLSELRKKVGEERKRLAEESGAIFASLDEEIATYSTFQKIKEKAVANITDYLKQLEKINTSYENASNSAERAEKKLEDLFSGMKGGKDYEGAEKLLSLMDTLEQKRKLLDEIKAGMDNLDSSAERSAKQVRLLAKEVQLLNLRTSGQRTPEQARGAEGEIKESISLTANEQHEFDQKREELRKLIKKLWEEE